MWLTGGPLSCRRCVETADVVNELVRSMGRVPSAYDVTDMPPEGVDEQEVVWPELGFDDNVILLM